MGKLKQVIGFIQNPLKNVPKIVSPKYEKGKKKGKAKKVGNFMGIGKINQATLQKKIALAKQKLFRVM